MHQSRLAGFIVDCQGTQLSQAAAFWSGALGLPILGPDGPSYVRLDGRARDLAIEVQSVEHPSRVHLDLETDDVEAEVLRLEKLGAKRALSIHSWCVMEAPTGQRFCVVKAKEDLTARPGVTVWP